MRDATELLARILLSFMFIVSGFSKINGYAATQSYMESMSVPDMLLPLVIALELGGGILLLIGYQTRIIALSFAGFCVASGYLFHFNPDDQMQMINFMKNMTISGGMLLLVIYGAGAWSTDDWRARKNSD